MSPDPAKPTHGPNDLPSDEDSMPDPAHQTRTHVPTLLHWRARWFDRTAAFWQWLSRIETAVLREDLDRTPIDRPIYIAGVPRSGTTLLTELLASHPRATSHRYSDFPNFYTPYWRNWLAQRSQRPPADAVERAHRDRILVTHESPEAVEEVIWSRFFEDLHSEDHDQALDASVRNPAFEVFYRDHIRKLLKVRGKQRYLAKGNYNTTRLEYLRAMFPDARFIVPVRNPVDQVASLIKQDRLFDELDREDPRVEPQLRLSGHHEFGPGRRPVILDADPESRRIAECWRTGQRVAGWAHYWNVVYRHVLEAVERDPALADATLFVRYEDLCERPEATIRGVLAHAELDAAEAEPQIERTAGRIQAPDYYEPRFSDDDRSALIEITRTTALALGYGDLTPATRTTD